MTDATKGISAKFLAYWLPIFDNLSNANDASSNSVTKLEARPAREHACSPKSND
jgi:hypothetical protein